VYIHFGPLPVGFFLPILLGKLKCSRLYSISTLL